jgi:hypothetical protein
VAECEEANVDENGTKQLIFSLTQFCARNNVSRSTCYEESKRGRLNLRKLGRKTVVLAEDELLWRNGLPPLRKASHEQA